MADLEVQRKLNKQALSIDRSKTLKHRDAVLTAPTNVYSRLIKPIADILFACLLLVLLSPVIILVAISIKLDSRGPIIFKQQRVGRDGKIFEIYKFRSMIVNTPSQARSPTNDHDPRVTRVGKFIRKTSLDEIPQLFNILKGEMSFIGPRPELITIVMQYYTDYERMRFIVKPGITGLWQVSPYRTGYIHENLQFDFSYIENLTLWTDIKVIFLTVKVMFFKSNTY